ncbi:MAG: glycosyltransferase family 9 protein [Betaproteobacteria bacterium]|nr:glycosyltransferase family 9 protein [Betaproteobacteria bacterium]
MRLLVVRQDNIGDLVVTTPVFAALRSRFPHARIEALVNGYSAPILAHHPDVDAVHAYTKDKHLAAGESRPSNWLARISLLLTLRRARFDIVLLASPGYRPRLVTMARILSPRKIASFVPRGNHPADIDFPVDFPGPAGLHHLEETFRILEPLGIPGPPPAPRLGFAIAPRDPALPIIIGIHVSARRLSQRWPEARFVELMRNLHESTGASFRLFWAPGAEDDPRHPGDDHKAQRIVQAAAGVPLEPVPTQVLGNLAEGIAGCDAVVCSDGGAMHIAAAMRKPVVCLFGVTDPAEWGPWGVPSRVVRPASRDVRDAGVAQVQQAFLDLAREAGLLS